MKEYKCNRCLDKGYIDGIENSCPYCNYGGEWRNAAIPEDMMFDEESERRIGNQIAEEAAKETTSKIEINKPLTIEEKLLRNK